MTSNPSDKSWLFFFLDKDSNILLSLELTTACKRINKDGCYEFVTAKSKENKSVLVI